MLLLAVDNCIDLDSRKQAMMMGTCPLLSLVTRNRSLSYVLWSELETILTTFFLDSRIL